MANSKEFSLLTKLTLNAAGFNSGIDQAKQKTNDLAKGTETAANAVKSSFGKLTSLGSGLTAGLAPIKGVVMGGVNAFKAMSPALQGVKGALISSGIGALVVALGLAFAALTSYLGGSSEGSKRLKEQFAYVSGAITAILNRLKFLGKALYQVFTGDFKGAAESIEKAFKAGFVDEIVNSAKEANARMVETNKLGKERYEYLHYEADTTAKINQLRADAMNKDELDVKSLKEKRNLLEKAEGLAIQMNERKVKLLTSEWELTKKTLAAKGISATKEDKEAELAKYQELRAAQSELSIIKKDISKQEFRLSTQIRKAEKEQEKEKKDEAEKTADAELKLSQINSNLLISDAKNAANDKRAILETETNDWKQKEYEKIDAVKATTDAQVEEQKRLKNEVDKIAQNKLAKGNKAIDNEEVLKTLEIKKLANDQEINLLNEKLNNNLISQKAYNEQIKTLNEAANQNELDQLKIKYENGEILESEYQAQLKAIRDKANLDQEIANKSVWGKIADNYTTAANKTQLYGNVIDSIGESLVTLAKDGKTSFKGLVMSMLQGLKQIINGLLAQAIAGQIAANSSFGLLGLGMAAVGMVAVEALFASLPAFETGGIINGNSFTGDRILARVNSGEMILNSTQQNRLWQLANYGGSNNNNVDPQNFVFKFDGRDMVAALDYHQRRNNNMR